MISISEQIWQLLDQVQDPEIPPISIVELGLIRSLGIQDGKIFVTMTPTFSACPAFRMMQQDILSHLAQAGFSAEVRISYSPPWSTNWITTQGRQKLRAFGIAPPPIHQGVLEETLAQPVSCPYCASLRTVLKNDFGATLCRSIYFCNDCHQPFEQFKPV